MRARGKPTGCFGLHDLATDWRAAVNNWEAGSIPCGPLGHDVAQLKWAGWKPGQCITPVTRAGKVLDPIKVSPNDMATYVWRDVVEETRSRASYTVRTRDDMSEQAWGQPWWDLLTKVYNIKRTTPLQRSILVRVVTGTYVSGVQLIRWGYDTTGMCECGALDDGFHRCF